MIAFTCMHLIIAAPYKAHTTFLCTKSNEDVIELIFPSEDERGNYRGGWRQSYSQPVFCEGMLEDKRVFVTSCEFNDRKPFNP